DRRRARERGPPCRRSAAGSRGRASGCRCVASWGSLSDRIGAQDESAGDLAVLEAGVRLGRVAERQHLADVGRELARVGQAKRGLELAGGGGVGAEDLELLDDDEAGVELDRAALEIADD